MSTRLNAQNSLKNRFLTAGVYNYICHGSKMDFRWVCGALKGIPAVIWDPCLKNGRIAAITLL